MRNFENWNKYLDLLYTDIYSQPEDEWHTNNAKQIINCWAENPDIKNVLDIGCGTGFCQDFFEKLNIKYVGIALGQDVIMAKSFGHNVIEMDMNFLDFPDNSFDLLFSRHSLEHSPSALLSLFEWHRVSSKFLILILPNPDYYGYIGRNHISVMPKLQIRWLLRRSGWKIVDNQTTDEEFRFACEKLPILGSEGWASEPLDEKIYKADRDDKSFKEYDDELRRYL